MTHDTVEAESRERPRARMFIHDDFCQRARFWGAGCTCGADKAETRQIVMDVTQAFARDLKGLTR